MKEKETSKNAEHNGEQEAIQGPQMKHERKIILKVGLLECSKEGRGATQKIRRAFHHPAPNEALSRRLPQPTVIAKLCLHTR